MRTGLGFNNPPPSRAKVEERIELYHYSHSGPSWPVLGWTLLLVSTFSVCGRFNIQWLRNREMCVCVSASTVIKIWTSFWRHYSLSQGNVDPQEPLILFQLSTQIKNSRYMNQRPSQAQLDAKKALQLVGVVHFGFPQKPRVTHKG
jgi:hypothetical protein